MLPHLAGLWIQYTHVLETSKTGHYEHCEWTGFCIYLKDLKYKYHKWGNTFMEI